MTGRAVVLRGDARHLPLPDDSVDLIVTSPPYFALRSYTDGGEHYAGQVGSEATPAEFIDALVECTREWVRVLKPSGSLWVNLGDKYVADNRGGGSDRKRGEAKWAPAGPAGFVGRETARQKSLMGLPWRYALRCIDDLGLILRAEVVWSKPNGLPESVTDRVRRSHEQWFHLTREPRYYSAVDEIREPHMASTMERGGGRNGLRIRDEPNPSGTLVKGRHGWEGGVSPLGKLPGSVWSIPSEPLRVPDHLGVDHFAAFPTEWPRRLIAGWSPRDVCTACGEGRRPVTHAEYVDAGGRGDNEKWNRVEQGSGDYKIGSFKPQKMRHGRANRSTTITGYVCACTPYTDEDVYYERSSVPQLQRVYHFDQWTPAPTTPGLVVDPFGGTGTTALVAKALDRVGVTVDLSADYCRLARWRTTDPGELAKAMRVPKPEPVPDAQASIFDVLDEEATAS